MKGHLFKTETRFLALRNLKEERKARGLTIRECAAHAGVSKSMMSYIENGYLSASRQTVREIEKLFAKTPKKGACHADAC
jgi:transcriptional regulator with XRE-family HTH domain